MKNIPKKIFLQLGFKDECEDFKELFNEAVTWADCRLDRGDIEYVLKSEYEKLEGERDEYKKLLATVKKKPIY
jgi:hypothetical protein